MNRTVSFIGAGNMNGALIAAAAKKIGGAAIVISDPDAAKTKALSDDLGVSVASNNAAAVATADFIVVGVKPQMMQAVLSDIAPVLQKNNAAGRRQILVSIAAGQKISSLLSYAGCGTDYPVVRIMPNTPAMIGEGMLLLSTGGGATQADAQDVMDFLSEAGQSSLIPESLQDSAGALTGCTPAFVYLFIEALADGAVKAGVPRDKALIYAAAAVKGSAALVLESGLHPGLLKDQVCSPGGSTIVGVEALEQGGFRAAAMNAVFKSYEKNRDLG